MKVKDLIEKLKEFDEDLEVVGMFKDEYGWDITEDVDVYKGVVKQTAGVPNYTMRPILQYGKAIPSTDVEVLFIEC